LIEKNYQNAAKNAYIRTVLKITLQQAAGLALAIAVQSWLLQFVKNSATFRPFQTFSKFYHYFNNITLYQAVGRYSKWELSVGMSIAFA